MIADLEHALGVRLLDRKPQGVETTAYGAVLERRSLAAFDELKQSIKDIAFLADPGVGELRLGCPESISAALLQPIVDRFTQLYPRVVLDVDTVNTQSFAQKLRDRDLDLVLTRGGWPLEDPELVTDLEVDTLLEDQLAVAVGRSSRFAHRRKVDIAELRDEPWILTSSEVWNYRVIAKAFATRGLEPPKITMKTISVHLRASMTATGRFITTFPRSVLHFHSARFALKELRVDLPERAWPIKIAKLKNRTMSPVVERFVACARDVAGSVTFGASNMRAAVQIHN